MIDFLLTVLACFVGSFVAHKLIEIQCQIRTHRAVSNLFQRIEETEKRERMPQA